MLHNAFFNQILTPIIQYAISPAIVLGIFLFLLHKMFKFGSLNQLITTAVKDIEDLKKDGRKFDSLHQLVMTAVKDIEDLKKDGKKLLSHVDIIKTHLVATDGLSADLFQPGSPLQLRPRGIALLESSDFKKLYSKNKQWFIDEVKKYPVKTLSEIDEASVKVLEDCKNENKFADYKELAFQNGLTVDVLIRTLAIYLRNEMAKEILGKKLV